MKKARIIFSLIIATTVFIISCKKDLNTNVSGSYKGTVRYTVFRHPDVVNPIKDTLFTNIIILISENGSSTPKVTNLDFGFSQSFNWFSQLTTLPLINNKINYYNTTKGAISSSQWSGQFIADTLQLVFRYDDHRMYVNEYTIRAQKQ